MAETVQTPVKTKRIRWIGKAEGVPRSVLSLLHPGGLKVYFPGDIIDDVEHLAALGEARIAELIAEGKAEVIKFVEGVFNVVKDIPSDMSDAEKARTQDLAASTDKFQRGLAKGNEALKKNLKASGENLPASPVPPAPSAGPSRSS